MSKYFPQPKTIIINSNVELLAFQCEDTVVQLASIPPGATFTLHQHSESQIGMQITGRLEFNLNGTKEILEPLEQVYVAGANVLHGSTNPFSETALAFDVKRITNLEEPEEAILKVSLTIDKITGFECQSVIGSWFEIIITKILPRAIIPIHRANVDKMGIVLNGKLAIAIQNEQQQLEYGSVYYAPAEVLYGGYNASDEIVTLIEILIKPSSTLSIKDACLKTALTAS
ncbi:cupin domain-containing protein [Nostocaceae cyanobacterium CENA369]|uniref:Cupin domain-containing protein n=1 Tax=Dendronalium phyllosphericum CENA369 TaxID=1725256 RepID=A0A8J7LIG2_9NOST|nr:cupin domain-containing protein [Dendronalium phyllosphericum]MBH8578111.1 cupin domain-containing protein [Dendronalium phyllosphericum CENA369]